MYRSTTQQTVTHPSTNLYICCSYSLHSTIFPLSYHKANILGVSILLQLTFKCDMKEQVVAIFNVLVDESINQSGCFRGDCVKRSFFPKYMLKWLRYPFSWVEGHPKHQGEKVGLFQAKLNLFVIVYSIVCRFSLSDCFDFDCLHKWWLSEKLKFVWEMKRFGSNQSLVVNQRPSFQIFSFVEVEPAVSGALQATQKQQ